MFVYVVSLFQHHSCLVLTGRSLFPTGDRFYIRILLNHVKNVQGYEDLRTTTTSSTTVFLDETVVSHAPTVCNSTTSHTEGGSMSTTSIDTTTIAGTTTVVTTITTIHATYKAACTERGLLMDDEEWDRFLAEAVTFTSAPMLRQLFATVLIECNPEDPAVSRVELHGHCLLFNCCTVFISLLVFLLTEIITDF